MKNKIVGICVCMLMIATVIIPAAGTMNERENEKSIQFIDHTKIKLDLCPDVVYGEPIGRGYPCSVPNDQGFRKQWYMHNTGQIFLVKIMLWGKIPIVFPFRVKPGTDIQAAEAWNIETGSPDVVIAIVDTGIDYTHPDLAANIWNNTDEIPGNGIDDDHNGYIDDVRGWDFYYNDSNVTDGYGHGTMCAGIAGAVGNNGIGIAGVAWNCKIMPVRVLNESAWGSWEVIAAGIRYAADNGADVISMSIGDYDESSILLDAVNYAYGKGVFLCAAAGNDGIDTEFYPAAFENVTGVGMTNPKDIVISNSNYGNWVDIAAHGTVIYSTNPTYPVVWNVIQNAPLNYAFAGATSMATPQVAGAAALLLSKDPSLTPDEVKALLCNNTDPYSGDHYIGTGRLNVFKALTALTSSMP
jgi:subtilisin family serine protease